MTKKSWTPLVLLFLCPVSLEMARADQLLLKNGDRVSGAIVKMDGKSLTVKTDALGTVTVAWDQVTAIQSDGPLHVVLPGGETVRATLATSEEALELKEAGRKLPLGEVVAIRNAEEQAAYERLLHPPWTRLWAGSATLGFAGTQGNAQTRTFTVGFTAARTTEADKTSLHFQAIKASALINRASVGTAQAVRGGWGYGRTIASRLLVNAFNDYEYDRFQDLDLRFVLGGGLGFSIWKGERSRLEVLAGGAYNREKFSPAAPESAFSRSSAEAYWGDDASYRLNQATSLVQSFRMFNNLSRTGDYRINFDVGANTRLLKWLTWTLNLSDRYLSSPVVGRKKNDILYTVGIGISFTR